MVLTIGPMVLTQNPRVSVSRSGLSAWELTLANVSKEDQGEYVCQINTRPHQMKSSAFVTVQGTQEQLG